MSHGFNLSDEELCLDKELKCLDVMEQIRFIAQFLDSSIMCFGFLVEKEHVSRQQLGTNVTVSYVGQASRHRKSNVFWQMQDHNHVMFS